jgi:hypothetical protein
VIDYTIQYRRRFSPEGLSDIEPKWDLLLSAYNESERVRQVFTQLPATAKRWFVQAEYNFSDEELHHLSSDAIAPQTLDEAAVVAEIVSECSLNSASKVCIDITGFMRHTLVTLIRHLFDLEVERFWLVYSDPGRYQRDERTAFSIMGVSEIRPVAGYQGSHDIGRVDRDWIVLGTGYDAAMMRSVVESKRHARRVDFYGLPSLQPSMYQENVLSVASLDELPEPAGNIESVFAPANDPFATAQALQALVGQRLADGEITNLYLSPTGTKAQVVGFALYYLAECTNYPVSMLIPLPVRYGRETSEGHARSWLYEVDLRVCQP